jgi:hypothetical protein
MSEPRKVNLLEGKDAKRVLSQRSSLASCERIWSASLEPQFPIIIIIIENIGINTLSNKRDIYNSKSNVQKTAIINVSSTKIYIKSYEHVTIISK